MSGDPLLYRGEGIYAVGRIENGDFAQTSPAPPIARPTGRPPCRVKLYIAARCARGHGL
jgi:hypothetical protein